MLVVTVATGSELLCIVLVVTVVTGSGELLCTVLVVTAAIGSGEWRVPTLTGVVGAPNIMYSQTAIVVFCTLEADSNAF